MSKIITIKLTKASPASGSFTIKDQFRNLIASDVPKDVLIKGISYEVDDNVTMVTLSQQGKCMSEKTKSLSSFNQVELVNTPYVQSHIACLWRHLTNIELYNSYYGSIEPYIIEYPFSYEYQDEILQNVQDYTKVYKYLPDGSGVFSYADKIELDNVWFSHAIVYNGQQSSGILVLEPKPYHNLQGYMSYPIYRNDSKVITFTKSDNFYQFNTFWSLVKDKSKQLFITSCESLSIDKIVNQSNMDYSYRSFVKSPLRAKEVKVRYILNNRSDVHLVSQFIVTPAMISYK
jgi:hypothetical protein